MVEVLDPEEEDIALKVAKKASVHVKANDILQKYGIHLIKTDQDGNKLAGAMFALKAKTDIINSKGENIFKKGDTIATTTSQDDQFEYLEFIGLPTDIYARMEKTVICMKWKKSMHQMDMRNRTRH